MYVASGLKKIMHSSPEVSLCKGVARTGFEVPFKLLGLAQGFKGNIELEFPGLETGRVPTFAGIMLLYASIEVGSMADVPFTWLFSTFENIGEVHGEDLSLEMLAR
jgi:hypothetical protein